MSKPENKKYQDKQKIVNTIIQAAKIYKNKMVGHHFLYVFEEKYIEVIYRVKDFMHLTGVGYNYSAEQFYKDAIKGTLNGNQIFFNQRHPYDLCTKKVSQLLNISKFINSELFAVEDMKTDTFIYKFGLTDLKITICFSEDTDKNGKAASDHYIARSFRVEDSFDRSDGAFEVSFVFSRENGTHKYNTIMYADKRYSIDSLPLPVLDMLDDGLKQVPEPKNESDNELIEENVKEIFYEAKKI